MSETAGFQLDSIPVDPEDDSDYGGYTVVMDTGEDVASIGVNADGYPIDLLWHRNPVTPGQLETIYKALYVLAHNARKRSDQPPPWWPSI